MFDWYRKFLAHAHWTWMEGKFSRFHSRPDKKDRVMSRMEKRAAKQRARKDMDQE